MSRFLQRWTLWALMSLAMFSNSTFAKPRLIKRYSSLLDIVFAIDESGSMLKGQHSRISEEFGQYVNGFYKKEGSTDAQFAVIACINPNKLTRYDPHVRLKLGETTNQDKIVEEIAKRHVYDKTTFDNFPSCFRKIRNEIFIAPYDRPNAPNVLIVMTDCQFAEGRFANTSYYQKVEREVDPLRTQILNTGGYFGLACYGNLTHPRDIQDFERSAVRWVGNDRHGIIQFTNPTDLEKRLNEVLVKKVDYYTEDCEWVDKLSDCQHVNTWKCQQTRPTIIVAAKNDFYSIKCPATKTTDCNCPYDTTTPMSTTKTRSTSTTKTTTTTTLTTSTKPTTSTTTTKKPPTSTAKVTTTITTTTTTKSTTTKETTTNSIDGRTTKITSVQDETISISTINLNTSATEGEGRLVGTEDEKAHTSLYVGIVIGVLLLLLLLLLILLVVFWRRRRNKTKKGVKGTGAEQKRKEKLKGVKADMSDQTGTRAGTLKKKVKEKRTANEGLTERKRKEKLKGVEADMSDLPRTKIGTPKNKKQSKFKNTADEGLTERQRKEKMKGVQASLTGGTKFSKSKDLESLPKKLSTSKQKPTADEKVKKKHKH